MREVLMEGNMRVIVHGVDPDSLERFLADAGAIGNSAVEHEITINAATGETSLYPAFRMVLSFDGVSVYLRVPGELCVTFEGDLASITGILGRLQIPHNASVLQNA